MVKTKYLSVAGLLLLLSATPSVCRAQTSDGPPDVTDYGSPLTPDEELLTFELADSNLTVELVASEPNVVSPVAIAWDAKGRLFVAEMIGYPSTPKSGRIKCLQDGDGDGRYEHATVFADGLSFPTSVMPYRDGVLVTAAPDILFLQDTNDDGVADVRHVEWTGFGAESQQLRSNALHWGIDNWIYGANGRCDGLIHRPGQEHSTVSIRARDFRFHPVRGQFQAITGQSQFGQAHDNWGNRFLSWNQIPIRHALVEQRYLRHAPRFSARAVVNIASPNDLGRVYPTSATPLTFNDERADYYNAMCGLTILRGSALGGGYQGDAFVCESLYNVIVRRKLVPSGPTFVAQSVGQQQEFVASHDSWFHPVFLTTGPDGALYVVDFYRQYVEHPRYVPPELREKFDWRNGYHRGRIWRIRHQDANFVEPPFGLLEGADADSLVSRLNHPNGWWRDTAQRLLIERADKLAVAALRRLATSHDVQPIARVHAVWTLHGLQALDDSLLVEALADPSPRVREHAIRLCEPRLAGSQTIPVALRQLVADPDPRVQFQLALTSARLESTARHEVLAALVTGQPPSPHLTMAVLLAAGSDVVDLLQAIQRGETNFFRLPDTNQVRFLIDAGELLGGVKDDEELKRLIKLVAEGPPANTAARGNHDPALMSFRRGHLMLLAGLARGLSERGRSLAALLNSLEIGEQGDVLSAPKLARQAGRLLTDPSISDGEREAAIELVAAGGGPYAEQTLLATIANQRRHQRLEATSVGALSALDRVSACRTLYADWGEQSLWFRRAVLQHSQKSPAAQLALVEALEQGIVVLLELPLEVESALRQLEGGLGVRVSEVLTSFGSVDRRAVINEYETSLTLNGDRVRGANLFKQHCLQCHTIARVGQAVGPGLEAVARKDQRELLEDILDPSRRVYPDFASYTLVTRSGKVMVGLIVAEIGGSVTLRRENAETVTVRREEIEELVATGQSLMPVGFEQRIDPQGMADLIAFLKRPDCGLLEQAP